MVNQHSGIYQETNGTGALMSHRCLPPTLSKMNAITVQNKCRHRTALFDHKQLVAIGVDDTGHREVVGVAEGMKEDKASWEQFIRSMIERGLRGVRLVVGDRCAGLVSTVNSMLPDARYQRCMVHFMRNVLSKVSHVFV